VIDEAPKVKVKEVAVLRKYEGDDQSGEPLETIVIEDGVIVDRWLKGEREET
jgi:hypothetical protein